MISSKSTLFVEYIHVLMQKRYNSIANALVLGLSCTNPSVLSDATIDMCMIHMI